MRQSMKWWLKTDVYTVAVCCKVELVDGLIYWFRHRRVSKKQRVRKACARDLDAVLDMTSLMNRS